ncbi:MAG: hypothetical protein ACW99F_11305 [Candidatus Hodarchaeales archaeon]
MTKQETPSPPQFIDQELKDLIYNHWKNINPIKEIEGQRPINILHQEVRSAILELLNEGIKEYDSEKDQILRRKVFSAREIHTIIKKDKQMKIKVSNIYFHLHKLQDQGLVKIVGTKKEERHIIRYYGRTARLFLWTGDPTEKVNEKKAFKIIKKLIKELNTELSEKTIEDLLISFTRTKKASHKGIKEWIQKNENLLISGDYDIREIYKFLTLLDITSPRSRETNEKLASLLDFKI